MILTDTKTDGMLSGTNIELIRKVLNSTELSVIASGGITDINDVKNLKAIATDKLRGCIIGKAIYENKIALKDAIETAI